MKDVYLTLARPCLSFHSETKPCNRVVGKGLASDAAFRTRPYRKMTDSGSQVPETMIDSIEEGRQTTLEREK